MYLTSPKELYSMLLLSSTNHCMQLSVPTKLMSFDQP